jgi:hypothetical protein
VPFGDLLVRAGRSPGRDVLRGGGGEVDDFGHERDRLGRRWLRVGLVRLVDDDRVASLIDYARPNLVERVPALAAALL